MSIRQYLLESKYTKIQSITESNDPIRDQYIEQCVAKKVTKVREQVHRIAETEMKNRFDKELDLVKKENRKQVEDEFIDKVKYIEDQVTQKNAIIQELSQKVIQKDMQVAELQENVTKHQGKLTETNLQNN